MTLRETDLFPPVKALFESEGYTVYSEVEAWEGRADVVAVNGPLLVVVELKTTLSLDLLEQAHRWRSHAHYVYVAVPRAKRRNRFAEYILCQEGIGLIEVDFGKHWHYDKPIVYPVPFLRPRMNRRPTEYLRRALRDEQRYGPPGGSAGGGYVTDYRLTMKRVRTFLMGRTLNAGWTTVDEILEHVHTHYLTPKQSLARALLTIETEWCEAKKENGKLMFRYRRPPAKQASTHGGDAS